MGSYLGAVREDGSFASRGIVAGPGLPGFAQASAFAFRFVLTESQASWIQFPNRGILGIRGEGMQACVAFPRIPSIPRFGLVPLWFWLCQVNVFAFRATALVRR